MQPVDSNRQWGQHDLPENIFHSVQDDVKQFNGRAVRVNINNNGTRTLRDLGSWGEWEAQSKLRQDKADREALDAAQQGKQNEFLGRFRTAVEGQEKLPAMASRIEGELGLPGLRSTSQNLIKAVAETPKVQTNATRGYNVNSNQLSRIIGSKLAELSPAAQQAVNQQQAGEQNLATRLGYEVGQQQKDLLPFTTEKDLLSDQLAREYSGFTTQKQNELQLVMQSIANGHQLTMQELQNANQLAMAKMQYDNTKKDASNLISISEGQTIFDPSTRQVVYTSPKTYKPSGGGASGGSWS